MANEITVGAASGQTLYALLRDGAGWPYNTQTPDFEAYTAANWASYVLTLSEQGSTGFYLGSVPPSFGPAGRYTLCAYQRSGASPAATDPALGVAPLLWTGSAEAYVLGDAAGGVSVSAYAVGQDPATYILATPGHKLLTTQGGQVDLDWSQPIPATASGLTLGRAALAAIAEGVGVWKYDPVGKTLVEYAEDATTVLRSFALTIDSGGTITQRL